MVCSLYYATLFIGLKMASLLIIWYNSSNKKKKKKGVYVNIYAFVFKNAYRQT